MRKKKIFVLDTNVLLHDPRSLFAFADNEIVIPFSVIEEIDNQKKRQDEIGRNARVASQELDRLREKGHLSEGVDLPSGGRIKIELNHRWPGESLPAGMDSSKYDNRILSVAHYLHHSEKRQVYLVTKDLNLRIMADVLGIPAQDFFNDKVDYARL
jgi:PhoH-like ATPase